MRDRPAILHGITREVPTGHGDAHITVNFDEGGKPFEVFVAIGKSGGCAAAQLEAVCRLVSLALRSGIPVADVVKQLRGITCCPVWSSSGRQVMSPADAVSLALEDSNATTGDTPVLEPVSAVGSGPPNVGSPEVSDAGAARAGG